MKKRSKLVALILAGVMLFSTTACSNAADAHINTLTVEKKL